MTTLQMAGYVAADKAGTVEDVQAAPSSRWDKVEFQKNGELSLTPDTTDGTVYMDEYVNYLVQTLGNSATASGIQGYNLDNEPVLWNQTHPLIHAETVSNNELISKTIALSRVVKSIDPNAEVYGPAFWGILPCIQAGNSTEYTDPEWDAVKNDYTWYMDFYLKQMADAEETYGTRFWMRWTFTIMHRIAAPMRASCRLQEACTTRTTRRKAGSSPISDSIFRS